MPLSTEQIERINAASLRILETVGVKVHLPSVLARLKEAGCREGSEADIVHIPPALVADAVREAPGTVTLSRMGGADTAICPGGPSLFWTCNALNIHRDGATHPIEEADFVDWTRVTDSLSNVFAAVAPSIHGYPPWTRDFVGFRLLAQNTTKHFRPCIYTPDGALAIIEMAKVLLGSRPIRERPIFSLGYTVVSPLQWSFPALALFEKTSGHGIPMMINAEPTSGTTSPVTLAGTLALANAEALSGVVITQLLEPGRPVIYNLGFSHTMDMRTAITRTGGPENGLLGAAGAQFAAFHGLPSASWAATESMTADQQSVYEFGNVALMHALAGVNVIWGVGQLESQRTISLEKGVMDNEICGGILRAARGIGADDDEIAEHVITEVAHKADYLGHPHTLKHFRNELFSPDLAFCGRRETWDDAGALSMHDRARGRVRDILSKKPEPILPEDVQGELQAIQARWMDKLAR